MEKEYHFPYEDLKIWQMAIDLSVEVYSVGKKFPREETYALRDQIQRAVVSVASNIAEGHGRKAKENLRFIDIALGSLNEVYCQLVIALKLSYITREQLFSLKNLVLNLQRAIIGYKKYLMQKI